MCSSEFASSVPDIGALALVDWWVRLHRSVFSRQCVYFLCLYRINKKNCAKSLRNTSVYLVIIYADTERIIIVINKSTLN